MLSNFSYFGYDALTLNDKKNINLFKKILMKNSRICLVDA